MTTETINPVTKVADVVRYHAKERPDKVAMYFQGRETTFAELDRRASQVGNGLLAEGLKSQARVALLDKNSDTFFEVLFGACKANTVLVAVNWRLAPPEISYVINDAQSEILFIGPEFFGTVEKIESELKSVKKIITLSGTHENWQSFEDWRNSQNDAEVDMSLNGDDVAMQLYTSGTTGHPKGAQLTNDNLFALLPSGVKEWGFNDSDVSLVSMPLFHIGGSGWALVGFYVGAKTVIVRDLVPPELLKLIPEQRISMTFWVPAVLLFLLQTPGCQQTDFSSMKLILYGASPIPLDLLRNSIATFKCDFMQVYGLTETTGAITSLPPEDHKLDAADNKRMRSCGRPFMGVEMRAVDENGQEAPIGQVGEIIVRSKQVMKGYWNLPDATAKAVRGEWFYTGDAGYFDEDGYLYIYDRVKDMIVSGGENIYPAEVESALFGHPAIADVAVIGVPDQKWGEAVKAVIVKKPGAEISAEEIIAYARERIAGYKVPKTVDFAEALPRNPSGKLLKREIRAPYWQGYERQVN